MVDDYDIKNAAEIREWLTKLIIEKQDEIERIKTTLSLIDIVLKHGSFRTAANMTPNSNKKTSSYSSSSSSFQGTNLTESNSRRISQSQISNKEDQGIRKERGGVYTPSSQYEDNINAVSSSSSSSSSNSSQSQDIRNKEIRGRGETEQEEKQRQQLEENEKEEEEEEEKEEFEETRQLKRMKDGQVLANVRVSKNTIEIVPESTITLYVDTPPFKSFFLNRILEGLKNKDLEKVRQGQLDESHVLSYDTVTYDADGISSNNNDKRKAIEKIRISNYRERERITEIFNTSAWVFARMLEKK